MPIDSLHVHRRAILELAAQHGARNVRVSAPSPEERTARTATSISSSTWNRDADVIALEQDLAVLLGRPVDVQTDAGLSPYLQQRILAEAAAL